MTEQDRRWRVGDLAASSGLSHRTLRYWDSIGLLSPSARTQGGHREYDPADLLRLYQILGLRSLGLPLDSIATVLDGGAEPQRIVADHLAHVDRRIAELTTARNRLAEVAESLGDRDSVTPDLLLATMRALDGPDAAALGGVLTAEQITTLDAAARASGLAAHYLLTIEWPQLYRQADTLLADGAAPDDPVVQRLVRRLDQLSAQFSGGDPEVSARITDAYRDDPASISGVVDPQATRWREITDFLDAARRTAHPEEHS